MPRTVGLSLVLAALLAAAAWAEETYTIKTGKSAKGDRRLVNRTDTTTSHYVMKDGDTALKEETEKTIEVYRYREEIVEKEADKRATRLRRQYEKAELTKGGKKSSLSFEGKTVLIEKQKDGKYRFQVEGGNEITGDEAKLLGKDYDKEDDNDKDWDKYMLPSKPVAVGATWKLDAPAIAREFNKEGTLEPDKATGTGKLLNAYKKDGHQCGQFTIHLEVPAKALTKDIPLAPGAVMKFDLTWDGYIDGTSPYGAAELKVQMAGTGTVTTPDKKKLQMTFEFEQATAGTEEGLPGK